MIIYGANVIPVFVAVVLLVWFKHKTTAWEFALPFVLSLALTIGFKFGIEKAQTTAIEFWGGWATKAEFFERWDEEVPCTHTKYCPSTCTRSDGSTYSCEKACGKKHLYDVDDHPARWVLHDSNGDTQTISSGQFEAFARLWNSRKFVDMHRDYHSIDGDKYVATWDNRDETFTEVTTKHTYENRVQAAHSVFEFEEIENPRALKLFDYPGTNSGGTYDQKALLGSAGPRTQEADELLRYWNAKLGRKKQVKMFLLVYGPDTTRETGLAQESYWTGGNKNEFTLAVGLNADGTVNWAHVISWTEVDRLKIDVREKAYEYTETRFDPVEVVEYMVKEVDARFVRKPFADFSYLTVEPPDWAVFLTYLLTLLANLGLSMWIIHNRHEDIPRRRWQDI